MGYLRRVLCVTLRDKDHRSEIRKAQDVKPLLLPAMLVRPHVQNVPGKNSELSLSGYSLHQCFSRGSAETDRNGLGRNSQPRFNAVVPWIIA